MAIIRGGEILANQKNLLCKIISTICLIWLSLSFFYPIVIDVKGKLIQINAFPEIYLIPLFGLWRIKTEKDPYQKKRVKWMIALFFLYWVIIPIYFPQMPLIDGTTANTAVTIHMVGALPAFLVMAAVLLIGKKADGGYNCLCVFDRETIGFAWRDATLKGHFWWKFRHIKWIPMAIIWGYFIYMLIDPVNAYKVFGEPMYYYIAAVYYLSYLIIPFTGHRSFCRWGCPWSATYGVLNLIGFYKIKADLTKCIDCGLCEQECDMGVPIRSLIKEKGVIKTTECMGCGRCVSKCPKGVLTFHDIRDFKKSYNINHTERVIRIAGGLTLSALIFLIPGSFWGYLGVAFLLTGIFGFCPTYALFKVIFCRSLKNKNRNLSE